MFRPICRKHLRPFFPRLNSTLPDPSREGFINALRNQKLCLRRPVITPLSETDFLIAERFTVRFRRVLLMRGTVTDMAVQDNESGAAFGLPENCERMLDSVDIVSVTDTQNVPSISEEPRGNIFRERDSPVAFNG